MIVGALSEGWATVLIVLVFAVLILVGAVAELRAELRRLRGGKPEGW